MNFFIKILKDPTHQNLKDILNLYILEKWWEGEKETGPVLEIINGSYIFIAAFSNNQIVGMGRAISDGVSDAYIQDVTVHKDYRGNNIGKSIINKIIEELKNNNILWIGLISEKNSHGFYEKLNFSKMEKTIPMKYNV